MGRLGTLGKKVPFKTRLRGLKPKQARHAVETSPMFESVYFRCLQMVNTICSQFQQVKRIEPILYKRMKFPKDPVLRISPASVEKDAQLLFDNRSIPVKAEESSSYSYPATPRERATVKHDAIFHIRDKIEYVIKDHMEMVEDQVTKLKHFIRYHGLSFDDMLF